MAANWASVLELCRVLQDFYAGEIIQLGKLGMGGADFFARNQQTDSSHYTYNQIIIIVTWKERLKRRMQQKDFRPKKLSQGRRELELEQGCP